MVVISVWPVSPSARRCEPDPAFFKARIISTSRGPGNARGAGGFLDAAHGGVRRVMCDNMRKHHLSIGIGLLLAVCAAPTRAHAKPQAAPQKPETLTASDTPADDRERGAPRAKTRAKRRDAPPCFAKPIPFARQLGSETETRSLSLTYCDGKPNPAALEALSVLSRSRHAERPDAVAIRAYQKRPIDKGPSSKRRNPGYVAPEVMRLHEGLLERLQRVADHFPGRTLEVVSGHRPEARYTSRHHHGRALDFRVQGVTRERLRDFLRGFDATGVGYYPNSTFVHMDVREDKGYWVDRSGPGEAADYGVWPPPKRELEDARDEILRGALADLAGLGAPIDPRAMRREPSATRQQASGTRAPIITPNNESAVRFGARSIASANRLLSAALSASLPTVESGAPGQSRPGATVAQPEQNPLRSERREIVRDESEPGDQLSAREVAQIRREALEALNGLR
jgi:hypothetical protein